MTGDITSGHNRQSRRSRPPAQPGKPKDGREKITLLLSKETNVKLSTLAALKGVDRSTLADSKRHAGWGGPTDPAPCSRYSCGACGRAAR